MRLLIFLTLVVCSSAEYSANDIAKVNSMVGGWFDGLENKNVGPASTTATTTTESTGIKFDPNVNNGQKACVTDDGQAGFCVNPSECDQVPVKTDPTDFTPRENDCHIFTPCCPEKKIIKNPTPIPPQTTTGCGWSNPNANVFKSSKKPFCKGCSEFGDFPFMIALLKPSQSSEWSDKYIGGGGLIHESVVVTAAHKLKGLQPYQLRCRAGEYDTQNTKEILPHQERDVRKFVIHENYDAKNAWNNIALLILKKPFNLANAPNIGVACLDTTLIPPGSSCFSMGWGKDFNDENKYAVLLKKISLPLMDPVQGEKNLKRTRLGSRYFLHESLTTAGGEEGKDTCVGDGGSPLVCQLKVDGDSTKYAIYGLVAYGVGCGLKDVPGVYVNVPHFYTWIGDTLAMEGLDKSSYVIS